MVKHGSLVGHESKLIFPCFEKGKTSFQIIFQKTISESELDTLDDLNLVQLYEVFVNLHSQECLLTFLMINKFRVNLLFGSKIIDLFLERKFIYSVIMNH